MKKIIKPTVEFRIPISGNKKYMHMLHFFLLSLREYGGDLVKDAKCVLSISRDEEQIDLFKYYPWLKDFSLDLRWMDQSLFDKYEYDGTGLDRFYVSSNADIIILCDMDILVAGNLDDVIMHSYNSQKQRGFIAHVSPFIKQRYPYTSSKMWWERIFNEVELPCPELKFQHTGWGAMVNDVKHEYCPYYFNYGFIVSPRSYIEKMALSFEDDIQAVDRVFDTWFKSQIANTISYTRHKIPCETLSINYNFPLHVNEELIRKQNSDHLGNNNAEDIKIFHYLGNGEFNREDFLSQKKIDNALNTEGISKSGKVFQGKLTAINNIIVSNNR